MIILLDLTAHLPFFYGHVEEVIIVFITAGVEMVMQLHGLSSQSFLGRCLCNRLLTKAFGLVGDESGGEVTEK